MPKLRKIPARLHANLILLIEEEAHRRRLFDVRTVASWLGVGHNSWQRWKKGYPMRPATAGKICDRLNIDSKTLQTRRYMAPAAGMVDRAIQAASQAATPWYRWCAIIGFGNDLLIWLSRHRIDAALVASIGGQPVRLSFRIGSATSDDAVEYEIIVEPTADVWVSLQQRIGCTTIPLIEGNASAMLLTEIIRYVRTLTMRRARAKGKAYGN